MLNNKSPSEVAPFWAVTLGPQRPVVSIVTDIYYNKLKSEKPQFYEGFLYTAFFSEKSYTALTAALPFELPGESATELRPVVLAELTPQEVEHFKIHAQIVELYKKWNLPPEPPWVHIKMQTAPQELQELLVRLEENSFLRNFL